jgi:hypothetical protein
MERPDTPELPVGETAWLLTVTPSTDKLVLLHYGGSPGLKMLLQSKFPPSLVYELKSPNDLGHAILIMEEEKLDTTAALAVRRRHDRTPGLRRAAPSC